MFSHITLGSNDLTKAEVFYDAVLIPLGLRQRQVEPDGGPRALCWVSSATRLPGFYVYEPFSGKPARSGDGSMTAFLAPNIEAVNAAYKAGMKSGGTCEGPPGPRPHYGEGYYGAYLRDLDGNKIHITYRGDLEN